MFQRILVALDQSDYSQLALPSAIEVAKKFGATIFVLHVVEHDRGRSVAYPTESPAEATQLVYGAVKIARDAGIAAQGELRDVASGHVAKSIVEAAAENRIDLIVMGSRGLSDVQGLLLGSVTHKVMQLAEIAVLVARGPVPVREKVENRPLPAGAPASA
jgi:nucleotide-binding universal stress UspA family protein